MPTETALDLQGLKYLPLALGKKEVCQPLRYGVPTGELLLLCSHGHELQKLSYKVYDWLRRDPGRGAQVTAAERTRSVEDD